MINSSEFYSTYHGHSVADLEITHRQLRGLSSSSETKSGIIWLAGDSSLDNKFWFQDQAPACNGYERFLTPPDSVQDIAYHINKLVSERGLPLSAINCAVEESRVESRSRGKLLVQDVFLRDHLEPEDYVIVSVGGNDIALLPTPCTIINMVMLMCCSSTLCIQEAACGCAWPCDDFCCGCSSGCMSCPLAFPPGLGYFLNLFGARIQSYINRLISGKHRPKKILVCMIYYPDEHDTPSWSSQTLRLLGYNSNPKKLQCLISKVFEIAIQHVRVDGVEVVAVPLFKALDGKLKEDYVARVEPSAKGGEKMSKLLLGALLDQGGKDVNAQLHGDPLCPVPINVLE